MYKKIYVPIDSSEVSIKILLNSIKLAKSIDADIRVTHVINFEKTLMGIELVDVSDLKDTILTLANKLAAHVNDVLIKEGFTDISLVFLENHGGNIAQLIINDAVEYGADLFVLHSNFSSVMHFITRNTVEEISQKCEIPILLMK